MSHAVDLADLETTIESYGNTPFLLYAGGSGSARANHVVLESARSTADGASLRCRGFGRGVPDRVAAGATLSLLWPPPESGSFSLIVDGTGSFDGDVLVVEVTTAVLHRPAPIEGAAGDCST